jgi:hypothetical protein
MGKRPAVIFEFGIIPKRKNAPKVKFDFQPLNPKRSQWTHIMGKNHEVKFEFGPKEGLKPQAQVRVRGLNDWQKP